MRILVVNAGSTSVKVSVVEGASRRVHAENLEHHPDQLPAPALRRLAAEHGPIDAVGHRIVHGGEEFVGPVVLDDQVVARIESLAALAPLHQAAGVAGIRAARSALPGVANVACFDTAFHRTLSPAARSYALPEDWRSRFGLRRFGFHGLSHAWAAQRAAHLLARPGEELRIVTCHLGGGASLCAVGGGRSRDTTMGFTPLEGLVMQTRSGSVDPGLVLWLIQHGGLSPDEVNDGLEHHAGLAGLTGTSGDVREVQAAAGRGDAAAVRALDIWLHRLVREIGAMAAVLGGLDSLVFTGGIGEHSPSLRSRTADRLEHLGVRLDPTRNAAVGGDRDAAAGGDRDADVSATRARCRTLVVKSGEDLQIATEADRVLGTAR